MLEGQEFSQPIKSVVKSYGGITGVSGQGNDKIAYKVGENKVLVVHKENVAPKENSAEFYKSQYYLHQILHILMPDNFPEIRKRPIADWSDEEKEWIERKKEEIKKLLKLKSH